MRTDALVLHREWTKASSGLGPLSGLPTFESLPGRTSCYVVALYGGGGGLSRRAAASSSSIVLPHGPRACSTWSRRLFATRTRCRGCSCPPDNGRAHAGVALNFANRLQLSSESESLCRYLVS